MSPTLGKVLAELSKRDLIPQFPDGFQVPLPAINKVELYLSFYGNDCCAHCIVNAGPHRKEVMQPHNIRPVLENIAKFSIINRLRAVAGGGEFVFDLPAKCKKLDELAEPPEKMTEELIQKYSDCLMGKGYSSKWVKEYSTIDLDFGRLVIFRSCDIASDDNQ